MDADSALGASTVPDPLDPAPRRRSARAGGLPPGGPLTRRGLLAAWSVALPYLGIGVCCGALVVTSGAADNSWFSWLHGMWIACLGFVPLAVVGAVMAAVEGSRTTMLLGIAGAVLCVPGAGLALVLLTA